MRRQPSCTLLHKGQYLYLGEQTVVNTLLSVKRKAPKLKADPGAQTATQSRSWLLHHELH